MFWYCANYGAIHIALPLASWLRETEVHIEIQSCHKHFTTKNNNLLPARQDLDFSVIVIKKGDNNITKLLIKQFRQLPL